MSNGTLFIYSLNSGIWYGNTYNGMTQITNNVPFYLYNFQQYGTPVHVTGNRFLAQVYGADMRSGLAYFEIDQNTGIMTELAWTSIPDQEYMMFGSYTDYDVIYDVSGSPTHLLAHHRDSYKSTYITYEWPFS